MLLVEEQRSLIEKFVKGNKNFRGNEDLFEDFDDFDNDDAQDQLNLFVQKLYALKYTMCTRQLNLIFQTNKEFFQAEDYNQCSLKVKIWKNLKTYLNFYFFSKENRFPEAWCYNIYSFLHIHRMKDN